MEPNQVAKIIDQANAKIISTAAQPAKVDPKAGEAAAPKVEEKVSNKLQVLMQREKAAVEREKAAKSAEEKATAREQALTAREAKITEFEKLKEKDPMKALELLGLNYQELTTVALADGNVTPELQIKKVDDKLNSYLKSQEDEKRRQVEDAAKSAKAQEEQATVDFKKEIDTFVTDNSTKYQLTQFEGQQSLVFDVIEEHYNKTMDVNTGVGKIMSITEAADKVEAYLEKRNEERLKLDKVKAKLSPQQSKPVVKQEDRPVHKQMRTLTNNQSATATRPTTHVVTDDERIAKAVAYAKGLRP